MTDTESKANERRDPRRAREGNSAGRRTAEAISRTWRRPNNYPHAQTIRALSRSRSSDRSITRRSNGGISVFSATVRIKEVLARSFRWGLARAVRAARAGDNKPG